ncbi:MAG TPA: hypothetical protein VMW78_03730 [Anaerolineae bacterium]|nr:hypothetical protein [Anaerolineae bacterium]
MATYRRKKDSDTWHSHKECSNWPISDYQEPTRYCKKCNECVALEKFDKQAQDLHDTSPLKNIPHWYIDLRFDNTFNADPNHILSLETYWETIRSCSYISAGYYRPHVNLTQGSYSHNKGTDGKGTNWIDSQDNNELIEYWRFHSNGQFVHFLSIEAEKQNQIGINSINNTIRDIFNFAGTLAQHLNATAFIKIRIVNIKGFVLYQDGGLPVFINSYPAFEDPCLNPIKLDKTALTSKDMDKLARGATASIFKSFNVNNITEKTLKKIQKDLRPRHLA